MSNWVKMSLRLPEELRLDEITAEGRLVFKGEQSDEGRLLILEAN